MPAEVAIFLIMLTFAVLFGFVFWISKRAKIEQARSAAKMNLQTRMLEKFSSAQEFVDFVSTPEGQTFLASSTDVTERLNPLLKLYQSMRWGFVLSLVGIGFIILSFMVEREMIVPGVLALTLGLGFLISSLVGQKLAQSWGLLSRPTGPTFTEAASLDR